MNLETAFFKIYGREAKPEETNRFNRLAKELDIRENDAIWSIVFLLGHHLELTEAMPEQMTASTKRLLDSFDVAIGKRGEVAETELRAAKARIEESVSETVVASAEREIARAAQNVARHTAAKSWLQWLGSAAIAGMLILAGAFYCGFRNGKSVGYASALDVKTAASWAATPSGQAAYHLDQNGDLIHIIRCDQNGWRISKARSGLKDCFVRPSSDGEIVGWQISIALPRNHPNATGCVHVSMIVFTREEAVADALQSLEIESLDPGQKARDWLTPMLAAASALRICVLLLIS